MTGSKKRRKSLRYTLGEMKSHRTDYLMLLPYMLLFTFFTVLPVTASIILGFTDFNLLQMPNFVGLDNYINLFLNDDIFVIAVKNTLMFAVVTGPISYFACLMLAWVVNELSPGMRTFMTFLFYAPSISGNLYVIWSYIFSGDMYGWANGILMNLGLISTPIAWLSDARYMMTIVMVVQIWMSFGTGFLSFVAGLQGIDRSMYEAGAIDGISNRFQELIYLTLPSMGPQLMFGAVMQISASFSAGAVCMALCGNPSTDYATSTIISHISDYGTTRYEMGYASAMATLLFVVMILTNNLISKILRKYTAC
mgnify:FL=1